MPMNATQRKALALLRKAADRAAARIGPDQAGAMMFLIGSQLLNHQSTEISDEMVRVMAEAGVEILKANPQLVRH